MITFLKTILFKLTHVNVQDGVSHPGVNVHVVRVRPPDELLLVLETEHGLGTPKSGAQLVLGELLLPDVSSGGAVTWSVQRSVPDTENIGCGHLPNIFNLCNCFSSSTSLNSRSLSSCFLRFQRDLWMSSG